MFLPIQFLPLLAQAIAPSWAESFFGLNNDQRFVLLLVVIGCTAGVICTVVGCVSGAVSAIHRRRIDFELKQDLLDRGMSADEVAQVVESSPPKDFLERWASGSKKRGRKSPPVGVS